MKKTYFIPAMEIIKIQTTGMLASSLSVNNTDASTTGEYYNDAPELPGIPPFVFE